MFRPIDNSRAARSHFQRLEISPEERQRLLAADRHLFFPTGPSADHQTFLRCAARFFTESAPPRLVEAIDAWQLNPDRPGVLVVDGLGVDPDLPPTPTDGRRSPDKQTTYSEKFLAAVALRLGQPVGFRNERHGNLIADLTPVRGKEAALTNEGAGRLGWHTEHNATQYLLDPPTRVVDNLLFFHLREDPRGEAKTLTADIRDALHWMSPDAIETLRQPTFVVRAPYLVRATLAPRHQEIREVPILTGPPEAPYVNAALYGDLTEATTVAGARALEQLATALDAAQRQLPTVPGRLVIVDNRRVMHSRFPFKPAFDGRDRWLQRCMVTASLEAFRDWQIDSPRILTPGS
ncbi:MAG: TauD/TfdA family dioxygenase [Planctomycetaceae bacterium]